VAIPPLLICQLARFPQSRPNPAFLNEQIYKGQASSGVQTVLEAHKDAPDAAAAALRYYFSVLKQSRWLADLNKLNDGGLTTLIETYSNSPQNGPTAVTISKR
jgi:hypothetical protein